MRDHNGTNVLLEGRLLDSPFADAFRALRANILDGSNGSVGSNGSGAEGRVRSLLVTSASAGEGRSTTVANLAIVIGRAGGHALVVDADLRHSSLLKLFFGESGSGERPPGLAELIRGDARLDQVILPTRFEGVWLLPPGSRVEQPADLFASPRAGKVIRQLSEAAEQVLIDTPPCEDYVDAMLLAKQTDAVVYVVRAGVQDREAQRQVQAQLQQAKARVLGVVLNDQ